MKAGYSAGVMACSARGRGNASFAIRHTESEPTIAIYVGVLEWAFRKEGSTLAEALAKVRAELVARFGEPS